MWQIFQQLEAARAIAADLKTHRAHLLAQIEQQNSPFQYLLTIISYDINQAKAFINLLSHIVDDPQLLNFDHDQEIKFYQPNPMALDANEATFESSYYQINLCNLQAIDNFIFIDQANLNPLLETLKINPQYQIYFGFLTFSDVQLYQIKAQHHRDKSALAKQWLNHIATKYNQQGHQEQQNPQWIHYCNQIVTNLEIYCWLTNHQLVLNQFKNQLQNSFQVQPPKSQPEEQQSNLNSKQIVYDDQF